MGRRPITFLRLLAPYTDSRASFIGHGFDSRSNAILMSNVWNSQHDLYSWMYAYRRCGFPARWRYTAVPSTYRNDPCHLTNAVSNTGILASVTSRRSLALSPKETKRTHDAALSVPSLASLRWRTDRKTVCGAVIGRKHVLYAPEIIHATRLHREGPILHRLALWPLCWTRPRPQSECLPVRHAENCSPASQPQPW